MSETPAQIRVLHVDDEPDFAELTATFLERENETFSVETATSAAEGWERLESTAFDCVVSDYDMPGRNGIGFLETVRSEHADLPFILYTGKGSEEIASDAISAGVTDYLQKGRGTGQYAVLANRIENAVSQHRSQTALEASQKRLSLFIDQSPLGVLEYDEEFEIVGLNHTGEEILGYSEDELVGKTWETLVTENSYDNVDAVTDQLAEAKGGYHSVDENVRKDGERIICEWHNRVVVDDDGDVVAVFSLFQDVTERERSEKELRETTARLKALFEESPDMINVHDTDGNIIDPNPRLCEETGYDASELVGMKVWELDRSIGADEARSLWEGMERGDRRRLDSVYRRKDGSTFPIEVHVRRLDLDGDDRFVVISRDVSERQRREQDIEETNVLLSTLVETLPVGVLAEDSERRVLATNERFFELFGFSGSPDDVVVADCERLAGEASDLFAEPDRFAERLDEVISALEPVHDERLRLRDGRTFARSYEPLELPHGSGHLWVYRDVSEQRERERRLQRQNERLNEFASVVSHDLRSPLNVVEGRLALAQQERESDHLDAATDALDRCQTLIDDLLGLAREGEDVGAVEPVDLGTLAEACWANVDTAEAALAVEDPPVVCADRTRLQQLVENLVRNAVEHGSTGSQNELRSDDAAEHGGSTVRVVVGGLADGFYVDDDGPGIPASERDRVFDPGYSGSETGTGFGLSIVEQVAEAHGWTVRLVDDARFEVTGVEFAGRADR